MNAFSGAVDAIFDDPNMASDVTWRSASSGNERPARIIQKRHQPDIVVRQNTFELDAILVDVRLSQIPDGEVGDSLLFEDGSEFEITRAVDTGDIGRVQTFEAQVYEP
ncbi:head-tail joining protein [Enterovirga sp. CN4-39]|uniref:head-tail joining protein n=1 Tax=Enterovirga sp. CN4-39 TaxID=3400910 RepID=UPI003C05FB10